MKRQYTDEDFSKRVVNAFINSEEEDDKAKTGFIMSLFGYESKIKKEPFEKSMQNKNKWFFVSKDICNKMKPFNNELWLKDWEEQ